MSFHLRPLTAFNLSPAVLLSIAERSQCVLRRKEGKQLQIPVLSTFWVDFETLLSCGETCMLSCRVSSTGSEHGP